MIAGLTGFGALAPGLVAMTSSRRWQWTWLIVAAVTMMLMSWLATGDPGALSKKFLPLNFG
jgi:hypothetical protein